MRYVRKLVAEAIAKGYHLSVNDGEEWTVKLSTDAKEVIAALASTDMDTLRVRGAEYTDDEGRRRRELVGDFLLVWGLDDDETIADHTDNQACTELYNALGIA
jgi:hypothetical protein